MSRTNVSIIIPFFNGKEYFEQCIKSVMSQTMRDIEIILVDDGSNDGIEIMADDYAANDTRIKVIHQKNKGVSAARNAAIKIATGEFIGFVDADDWVLPEMFETMYNKAARYGTDIVACGYISYIDKENTAPYECKPPIRADIVSDHEAIKQYAAHMHELRCFIYSCRCIFKRSLIVDNSIEFDERIKMGEDTLFSMKCYLNAKSAIGADEKMYRYRLRKDSATRKKYKPYLTDSLIYQYDEKYKLCMNYFPELREEFLKDAALYSLKSFWFLLYMNIYSNDIKNKRKQLKKIAKSPMMRNSFSCFDIKSIRSRSIDWYVLALIKYRMVFLANLLACVSIKVFK